MPSDNSLQSVLNALEKKGFRDRSREMNSVMTAESGKFVKCLPHAYSQQHLELTDRTLIFYLVQEFLESLQLYNTLALFNRESTFDSSEYNEFHPLMGLEWFLKSFFLGDKYFGLVPIVLQFYKSAIRRVLAKYRRDKRRLRRAEAVMEEETEETSCQATLAVKSCPLTKMNQSSQSPGPSAQPSASCSRKPLQKQDQVTEYGPEEQEKEHTPKECPIKFTKKDSGKSSSSFRGCPLIITQRSEPGPSPLNNTACEKTKKLRRKSTTSACPKNCGAKSCRRNSFPKETSRLPVDMEQDEHLAEYRPEKRPSEYVEVEDERPVDTACERRPKSKSAKKTLGMGGGSCGTGPTAALLTKQNVSMHEFMEGMEERDDFRHRYLSSCKEPIPRVVIDEATIEETRVEYDDEEEEGEEEDEIALTEHTGPNKCEISQPQLPQMNSTTRNDSSKLAAPSSSRSPFHSAKSDPRNNESSSSFSWDSYYKNKRVRSQRSEEDKEILERMTRNLRVLGPRPKNQVCPRTKKLIIPK